MVVGLMTMTSDHLDAIKNQLQLEKNDEFRQSAFVAFLENKESERI